MKVLAIFAAFWISAFLIIAVVYLGHGHGRKDAAAVTTTTSAVTVPGQTTSSGGSTVAGAGTTSTTTLPASTMPLPSPANDSSAAGGLPTSEPGNALQQQQLTLATDGYPALAYMPYRRSGVEVTFTAASGGQIDLQVNYSGRRRHAEELVDRFLASHNDHRSSYTIAWVSGADQAAAASTYTRVQLALRGDHLVTFLPLHRSGLTLGYGGLRDGKPVVDVLYRGSRIGAATRIKAILASYHDLLDHYILEYRKVG